MVLDEIDQRWRAYPDIVNRKRYWQYLILPHGGWMRCFVEVSDPGIPFPPESGRLLETWLDGEGALASPARFSASDFSGPAQLQFLRACYHSALLARAHRHGALPDSAIKTIAANVDLAPGIVADLVNYLSGKELRPAYSRCQLTVLLINSARAGVPAMLTLESLADGSGTLYPAPELSLCRDQAFIHSEHVAAAALSTTSGIDVRWSLQRLDGDPLGHLTGQSMGGAFALALHCLLNKPAELEPGYLRRVAVSSALDEAGTFIPVGNLWDKLSPASIELANPHTLIVSTAQDNIPVRYLDVDASPMVFRTRDVGDAVRQLQEKSLAWRAIRHYEWAQCKELEFRLPAKSVPISSAYTMVTLYRKIKTGRGGPKQHPALDELAAAPPGTIMRWEDEIRSKARQYQSIDLPRLIASFPLAEEQNAPRLLILGSPGSGKTALIQYLAWAVATDTHFKESRVPARIRLRDWERWAHANPETGFADYLSVHYGTDVPDGPGRDTWTRWLNEGRTVLLLDGMDEIEDEEWFREMLSELLDYRKTPLIMTARSVAFRLHASHFESFAVYWLGPLRRQERNNYIQHYPAPPAFDRARLIAQLDSDPALQNFAENPLLLSITCFASGLSDAIGATANPHRFL